MTTENDPDDDPDASDGTERAPEGVLTPEDLGLDDDSVRELDEDRFVVPTDESSSDSDPEPDEPERPAAPDTPDDHDDGEASDDPDASGDHGESETDASETDAATDATADEPADADGEPGRSGTPDPPEPGDGTEPTGSTEPTDTPESTEPHEGSGSPDAADTAGRPASPPDAPSPADGSASRGEHGSGTGDAAAAVAALADTRQAYAVDLTVKTDNGIANRRIRSDDVREVFEGTLRWYAGQIAPDRPTEEVLDVLLSASDLDV